MPLDVLKEHSGALAAVILAVAASIWGFIRMIFKLHDRVEQAHRRIDGVERLAQERHEELKTDIKELGDKTEQRHDRIEDKLDRLIERGP